MSGLLIVGVESVSMDEPCFALKEVLEPAADSKSVRRIQVLKVIRQDHLAEYRRDMGPADSFSAGEFVIPGGVVDPVSGRIYVEETVGSLMDIADHLRSDRFEQPEPKQGVDLVKGYYDSYDKKRRRRKGQSTFGYGGHYQRSS